jgi:hypothetical protein
MQCTICMETIENSCLGSCMHHFCYKCLIKWCHHGANTCPICKQIIYEIKLDKEFDEINNNIEQPIICEYTKKITIDFIGPIPPGITLCNNRGPGIKIKFIKKKDKCYMNGLREQDIILFIDRVPCVNHYDSIQLINKAFSEQRKLLFEILILKN